MAKKARSGSLMIRVITYNVEYGNKISEIYKWLNSLEKYPDLICLQEFPITEIENLKKIKVFEELGFSFVTGLKKKGIPCGELTLFDSKNYELLNSVEIDLGQDHAEKFYKRYPTKRSALITTFKNKNKIFSVVNVHLSAATLNSGRRSQIKTILNIAQNKNMVIAGDFNYSNLLGGKSLISMMMDLNFKLAGENIITNKYKGKILQQLDYVFYRGFSLKDLKVIELPYSDHYPILVELTLE